MKNDYLEIEQLGNEPHFIKQKPKKVQTSDLTKVNIYLYYLGLSLIVAYHLFFKEKKDRKI